jgi:hypothetical protein
MQKSLVEPSRPLNLAPHLRRLLQLSLDRRPCLAISAMTKNRPEQGLDAEPEGLLHAKPHRLDETTGCPRLQPQLESGM